MILGIQALRGLAITLVVFSHWQLFGGNGWIGVDVFFVISGFVVTRSALLGFEKNRFYKTSKFLFQRFRRLAPALAVTVLLVTGLQFFISPEFEYSEISQQGLWALAWLSNVYSEMKLGDYFGEVAGGNLLLHTWSLSVEFQAYLILALIFSLFIKKDRRFLLAVVASLVILSLVSSFFGDAFTSNASSLRIMQSYFSPIPRFYEIGVGVLIAAQSQKPIKTKIFAAIGFLLIAAALFLPKGLFGQDLISLLAVAGAAFALLHITRLSSKAPTGGLAWLVVIGNYSYSIYLWHWPVNIIGQSIFESTIPRIAFNFFVTSALSFVSFKVLEQPFMSPRIIGNRSFSKPNLIPVSASLTAFVLLSFSTFSFSGIGYPPLQSKGQRGVLQGDTTQLGFTQSFNQVMRPCPGAAWTLSDNTGKHYSCYTNTLLSDLDLIVLGNSHAGHMVPGLLHSRPELRVRYYSFQGGFYTGNSNLQSALAEIRAAGLSSQYLLINSFWEIENTDFHEITNAAVTVGVPIGRLVLMDDVPNFKISPTKCKFAKLFLLPVACQESLPEFMRSTNALKKSFQAGLPSANVLKSSEFFRVRDSYFSLTRDSGIVFFRDQNHLNFDGSIALFKWLDNKGELGFLDFTKSRDILHTSVLPHIGSIY